MNRGHVTWWTVAIALAAAAAAVLAVVSLGGVSAYTPQGQTHCGRALQELPHLIVRVAGRCHIARQAQLWLGMKAAGAALLIGLAVVATLAERRRK